MIPPAAADPLQAARDWIRDAAAEGLAVPEAMCLATCSRDGGPSARMVLFRGFEADRLVFFTDYRSRKARELEADPRAALVFHWEPLSRQLRIEGRVERLSAESSERYFASRPRASRISAWTSRQSAEVRSREELEERRREVERRFEGQDVPRPHHWGGYGLRPSAIEFWHGRRDRFHERIVFRRDGDAWVAALLEP